MTKHKPLIAGILLGYLLAVFLPPAKLMGGMKGKGALWLRTLVPGWSA